MNWLKTSVGIFIALSTTLVLLGSLAAVLVWVGNTFGVAYAVIGVIVMLAMVSAVAGYFAVNSME